ncbi:MAG TPA: hypothetical protein VKG38_03695, partial [Solirubrobacteraceae bacterium]|nr:hypothetical protein [Solirubrobacteraceae bacterium]
SAANGLQACTEAQVGYQGLNPTSQTQEFTSLPAACPDPSKLGTVEIETPLLPGPMTGSIYLAEPAPSGEPGKNPFGSLAAVYMVAEEPTSRVLVKLAGEAKVSETTGQVTATFHNTPQLPFENLELKLFSGPRASLTSPSLCGTYQTEASLTPWSGTAMVSIVSPPGESFQITSGPGGSQCSPDPQVFAPGFQAGSTNLQAGAFTSFALELSRPDGDEALQGVALHLPSGFAAMLSSVQLCEEPQASRDECPQGSEVGQATAVAGLGPEPYTEAGGRVYITGPDGGAPFGLEIVAPAVAGPFDLGTVTVRSKIYINPADASLTIVSDPVPTQLKGIPLQLKRVLVSVDHPNFQFNPTACNPTKIEGRLTGAASFAGGPGATATVSSPFQLANCASLPFAPKLTASTYGQASKAGGASLDVKVQTAGLGDANIAKVDLQLPKALPARLTTLQKACTSATFEANPATCPEASNIGVATIHTPILRNPLSGPGYLVSHGGTAFPDIEFVLQGEGVTIVLDGKTVIKNGITHSNFESAPDAPFTTFEAVLPAGPHSALAANVPKYHLCGTKLAMPTVITGQNGAVIRRMTTIAVGGCKAVKASRTKKLTRAQKLSRALKACRKNYRRSRSRRTACERNARDAYKARPLRRPLR